MIIHPARLSPRPRIGICAPSSTIIAERFNQGCAILKDKGCELIIHLQTFAEMGQIAGSAEMRADAFQDLLLDDSLEAIFCAAGGNRAAEILPLLDWTKIATTKPKIVMGFSDNSVVINAIAARLGWVSVFGPTVQHFKKLNEKDLSSIDAAWNLMRGEQTAYALSYDGAAIEGRLIVCTLSMLFLLLDTPNLLPLENAILCIEDVGEELNAIDRNLINIRQRAQVANIAALICGSFSDTRDTGRPFGFSFEDIVRYHMGNIPVAFGAPFGHGDQLHALPIGIRARLHNNKLCLLEPAFI